MNVQVGTADTAGLDLDLITPNRLVSVMLPLRMIGLRRAGWLIGSITRTSFSRRAGTGTSTMPYVSGFSYLQGGSLDVSKVLGKQDCSYLSQLTTSWIS